MHAAAQRARERRPAAERARAQEHELPVGQLGQLVHERTQQRPLGLPPLEHDEALLGRRREPLQVDAERYDLVAAGEAEGRGVRRRLARREERVEPPEQTFALRPPGRVAEALRREERRRRQRRRVTQREVGEAREAGLEAVDDVEASGGERERKVGAHANRHAHAAAA